MKIKINSYLNTLQNVLDSTEKLWDNLKGLFADWETFKDNLQEPYCELIAPDTIKIYWKNKDHYLEVLVKSDYDIAVLYKNLIEKTFEKEVITLRQLNKSETLLVTKLDLFKKDSI